MAVLMDTDDMIYRTVRLNQKSEVYGKPIPTPVPPVMFMGALHHTHSHTHNPIAFIHPPSAVPHLNSPRLLYSHRVLYLFEQSNAVSPALSLIHI